MERRKFIQATGMAVGAASMGGFACGQTHKKPNILFVFADQLRSMELGCYGGNQVKTPNIDRLAGEGVLFKRAFSTNPVCSPFRAMLMTGNFPAKNGMVVNDHFLRSPTPYFAEVCKSSGYKTGYIGKWHIDGFGRTNCIPPERWRGFDYWRTLECTHNYFKSAYFRQDEQEARTWPEYDAVSQTKEACNFISETSTNDPFCLILSWGPPHDPYIAPPEYMERFAAGEIHLRDNVNDFDAGEKMWNECNTVLPEEFQKTRESIVPVLKDRENTEIKKWYKGYYAAIETIDDCMGMIFQTLEKKGELDNTIIVFTSDHGDNLGSHRQHGKEMPYEESISIPFLIRYPGKIKPGTTTDALLAPVDMMPTLFSLANIPCPAVDGQDISSAALGRDRDVQDAVLLMKLVWLGNNWITNGNGPWRGVRTKRYTYARRSDSLKPWLLFDNETDPWQVNNLVDDPKNANLLKELDAKTNELLVKAGDPENPLYFANQIQEERNQHGQYDRRQAFFPVFCKTGIGFKKYI
jgi:arylsulfatase A-like enzyme